MGLRGRRNANRMFLYAGLIIIGAGVFDMVDGRVARQTNQVSVFGAFFDSVMDRYSDVAIFFGLLVYYARGNRLFYVGLVAFVMTACLMVSYTRARAEALIGTLQGRVHGAAGADRVRDPGCAVQPVGRDGSGAVGAGAVLDDYGDSPHTVHVPGDGAAEGSSCFVVGLYLENNFTLIAIVCEGETNGSFAAPSKPCSMTSNKFGCWIA